jgi:hypothetical protein
MTDIAKSNSNNNNNDNDVKASLNKESLTNSSKFDPRVLIESFSNSLIKSSGSADDYDDVLISHYLFAYEELVKFLEYLGQLFYFVVIDVKDKIQIMQRYQRDNFQNYETIAKMVKYEQSQKMFENGGYAHRTTGGTRTILRLHRALIFVYKFLATLQNADPKIKSAQLCVEAYDSTLAKHHSWIVRKTVRFGVVALPRRETLLDYMSDDREELNKNFPQFIKKVEKVYDITQKIYENSNILELS